MVHLVSFALRTRSEPTVSPRLTIVRPASSRSFLPLQWAALNNRVSVATFLIEKGAAVNATDNDKQTPLHWACVRGSLPCAELLLRSGRRVDQSDCRGYDAVHVAAQYGHTNMLYHFKMRWNADVDTHDNDGRVAAALGRVQGFPRRHQAPLVLRRAHHARG